MPFVKDPSLVYSFETKFTNSDGSILITELLIELFTNEGYHKF